MDLSDLHIFRSVVEAGGVTRAAEKLNRVQSNVTTRVRQLESELGVDLFVREGKLSVSVATRSPRGALLHFGVNVETEGTPVRAAGLRDLRLPPREYLAALGRLYADELASAAHAAGKVRPVP